MRAGKASTALLANGVLHRDGWDANWQFWFIEAFVWICLGALALVSVPRLSTTLPSATTSSVGSR